MSFIAGLLLQTEHHIDGLVQDYSNSSALAMELLQSCTKPLICFIVYGKWKQQSVGPFPL